MWGWRRQSSCLFSFSSYSSEGLLLPYTDYFSLEGVMPGSLWHDVDTETRTAWVFMGKVRWQLFSKPEKMQRSWVTKPEKNFSDGRAKERGNIILIHNLVGKLVDSQSFLSIFHLKIANCLLHLLRWKFFRKLDHGSLRISILCHFHFPTYKYH